MILWEGGKFLISARFRESCCYLLIVYIRDSLEEEQRENIGFEVRRINRSSKNIRRFPQVVF